MSATVNLRGLLETNRPLSATWNRTAVESITIDYDETLGLQRRGVPRTEALCMSAAQPLAR